MPLIKGTSALKLVADFMVDDLNPYPAAIAQRAIPSTNALTQRGGEPVWSGGKEVIGFILKSAAIKREQSRLVLKPGLVQDCYPHTAPKAQLRCTIAGLAVGISLLSLFEGSRERQVKSTILI